MAGQLDFALGGESHDLILQDRDLLMVSDAEQVAQHVTIRLRFFYSEWFLDNSLGVPWLEEILVKNPDGRLVDARLKEAIRGTPGLDDLVQFQTDYQPAKRFLSLTWQGNTPYGPVMQQNSLRFL